MTLRIDRLWGQPPGWFMRQPRPVRVALLAEFRLLHETPEQAKAGAKRAKRAEFDQRLRRARHV